MLLCSCSWSEEFIYALAFSLLVANLTAKQTKRLALIIAASIRPASKPLHAFWHGLRIPSDLLPHIGEAETTTEGLRHLEKE